MPSNVDQELEKAIKYFHKHTGHGPKQKKTAEQTVLLQTIQNQAQSFGLSPEHISILLDAVVSGQFAESATRLLIRSLVPASFIPEGTVIRALSHISTNQSSIKIQSLLLKWILLVYDYISSKENIQKLYGIIFLLLENQVLMPHVCHLLYLLTRKEDVRLYRVRRILMLQKKLGNELYLSGLLALYKLYYPNSVTMKLPRQNKLYFPPYEKKWQNIIQSVQERNQNTSSVLQTSQSIKPLSEISLYSYVQNKRRKLAPIPTINCDAFGEVSLPKEDILTAYEDKNIPFTQISEISDMLDNIDKIELPSQSGSVLKSPVLQHVMSVSADCIVNARYSYWLQATFSQYILDSSLDVNELNVIKELMEKVSNWCKFLQEGSDVVDDFLSRFLHTWNGKRLRSQLLQLLTSYQLCCYDKLLESILEPIEKLFTISSVYFKCQMIIVLTTLMQNFARSEWERYRHPDGDSGQRMFFGDQREEEFDPQVTFTKLVSFISGLCVRGLQMEGGRNILSHCVWAFCEEVADLHLEYSLPFVTLLDNGILPRFLLSPHITDLSRLCSLLCRFNKALYSLKSKKKSGEAVDRLDELSHNIRIMNSLVVDVIKVLWKGHGASSNFLKSYEDSQTDPGRLDEGLVFYHHPALLPFVFKFLKEADVSQNLTMPREIKYFKQHFTDYLKQQHILGIPEMIATFISPQVLANKSS